MKIDIKQMHNNNYNRKLEKLGGQKSSRVTTNLTLISLLGFEIYATTKILQQKDIKSQFEYKNEKNYTRANQC